MSTPTGIRLLSFPVSFAHFTVFTVLLCIWTSPGVVLRPGFIYGKRRVDGFEIPLDLIGEPLEKILRATENLTRPLSALPASDLILAPPVSVDDVALAAVNAITDDDFFGIFTIEQIKEAAAKVSVWLASLYRILPRWYYSCGFKYRMSLGIIENKLLEKTLKCLQKVACLLQNRYWLQHVSYVHTSAFSADRYLLVVMENFHDSCDLIKLKGPTLVRSRS